MNSEKSADKSIFSFNHDGKEDSLKKRYVYKLLTNLFGLLIGLVTQAIVPRGLGPKAYGDFSFLSNFFSKIVGFFDMGTSIGFYTKLSQRQKEIGMINFYASFAIIASIALFLIVVIVGFTPVANKIWPDQFMFFVYLAAIWGIFSWFIQILNKMVDAFGLTVPAELARIAQKIIGLILILGLFFFGQLNLRNYFFYQYGLFIILGFSFVWIVKSHVASLRGNWKISKERALAYAKEFYQYSHPLFVYALVVLFVGILDRWLLQVFSGSVQQGFYGLSYQIGAICFLFSGAMTPLITREFSISYAKNDLKQMAYLFRRYIPLFYGITAFFSCFIAMQAKNVAYLFGGSKFQGAALTIAIMAFYPIYQTYGQLSGAVFYATGQTGLYRNIGVIFAIIELPATYFLIAPVSMMGLNTGSTGLAVKTSAFAFIGVNVQLFFNARLLNLPFIKYLGHQILCVGFLIGIALFSKTAINGIGVLQNHIIISFLLSGILYSVMVIVLVYLLPVILGLRRDNVTALINTGLKLLKTRLKT
jgi:O-antigen/teichoic acid export membrane protein